MTNEVWKDLGIKCRCGKPSVIFDTWFNYYPCEDHKYMTPVEYSRMEDAND